MKSTYRRPLTCQFLFPRLAVVSSWYIIWYITGRSVDRSYDR